MKAHANLLQSRQNGGQHLINRPSQEIFGLSFCQKWVYQHMKLAALIASL